MCRREIRESTVPNFIGEKWMRIWREMIEIISCGGGEVRGKLWRLEGIR